MTRNVTVSILAGVALAVAASGALANPIVAGFNANTLAANDDLSTGAVSMGFDFNFFGTTYNQLYVNNNGNVTFNAAMSTYTPFGLTASGNPPIIAPFFADVDTRASGSGVVSYGTGTFGGHSAFGANWPGVGYFGAHADLLDTFQLLLVDRSDIAAGDADVYFNYGSIQWETGDASNGSGGFGGSSAHVGYTNGTGDPGTNFELAGSGVNGAFVDGGPNALNTGTNDGVAGQFLFQVRSGEVAQPQQEPPPVSAPEPGPLALLAIGLAGMLLNGRRRKSRA